MSDDVIKLMYNAFVIPTLYGIGIFYEENLNDILQC